MTITDEISYKTPQSKREYQTQYREKNKELLNNKFKEYYKKNKDIINEKRRLKYKQQKEYKEQNSH